MDIEPGEDLSWSMFWEFYSRFPQLGGFQHYSYEPDKGPDIYELGAGNIDDSAHMFDYCITFKGVRIYRAKIGPAWYYVYLVNGQGRFKGQKFAKYVIGFKYTIDEIIKYGA